MSAVPDVLLTLLGLPSLAVGGRLVTPPLGAKELGLLAFLALRGRSHAREELAGLLWGESPEAEARASLRQALKHIRERVGEVILASRERIELARPIECDVLQFRLAVHTDPRRAAAYDVSRFLAGFSVRHAPRFDEWLAATRQALVHEYEHLLGDLARHALAHGRWREATEFADHWLVCDPLSDEAARMSIEARYLAGDRGAALARFRDYAAILKREAGCEASRALLGLVRRVESDTSATAPRPAITDEWPLNAPTFDSSLLGREAEWSVLARSWKAARRGGGAIVLIEGEAGVGKTRLAGDLLRWVVADGGFALRGRSGDVRAGFPFASAVEVLRNMLAAPGLAGAAPEWLAELSRLLPELRHRFPALPGPSHHADETEGSRLFEAAAQVLLSLSAESPIVVLLDDLQWFDAESCNLFRYIIRRLEGTPVLWLLSVTLGELEREAPSARFLRVLRAKSAVQTLSLAPLTGSQVEQMVAEMGPASAPDLVRRLAGQVHAATAGNPFYILELLKTLFSRGLLTMAEGTGAWLAVAELDQEDFELPLPQNIQDVIAERIERLPERMREILITIAVSGAGCRPGVLSHVHGISRLYGASLGDALAERRLVVARDGTYRCAHRIIEQVVREHLTDSRRRELHRILAEAMEAATAPQDTRKMAAEIARHADLGGHVELAYRQALLASEEACTRRAYAEALAWLDLAASSAQPGAETDTVNRLTAEIVEVAAGVVATPAGVTSPGLSGQRLPDGW
jgi:DNA-binding SARP family transcriptional activator